MSEPSKQKSRRQVHDLRSVGGILQVVPRWLRIGALVVILTVAVLWAGGDLGTRASPGIPSPAQSQSPPGATPPALAATSAALAAASSVPSPPPVASPSVQAINTAGTLPAATPPQAQLAPPPTQQYQTLVAPAIRTLFVTLANTEQTITWPGTAGTSFQCQWSTDRVQWTGFPLALVGPDGLARCSVIPKQTAYYRAYFPATQTYGETVRGVVTAQPGWSGYLVGYGPYTFVTGTFTVPALVPSPAQTDVAEWVGIGGNGTDPLIQAGAWETYDPSAAQPLVSYAWWEVLPAGTAHPIPLPVSPGDTMTVTIWQQQGTQWAILLTNDTSGQQYPVQPTYTGSGLSADWIVEAPVSADTGAQLAFGHYTPAVAFSHLGFLGPDTTTIPLHIYALSTGALLSVPSALSSDGRSFSVAYGGTVPSAP